MSRTRTTLRAVGFGLGLASGVLAPAVLAQALNVDFGEPGAGPAPSYGAAGLPGVWNSLRGDHGTTTRALLGLDGQPTAVSLRQIGGLDTPTMVDPSTTGDDSELLDDYLVTFSASLETCVYFAGLEPGPYEVLIYALMPNKPAVLSYTDVDQEPGNPHLSVGGAWPGSHQQLVSFSRHLAMVGPDGSLQLHSGIVPGANPAAGAALNGLQLRPLAAIFEDGFESGDLSAWSVAVP
jgi:hypothetical protein